MSRLSALCDRIDAELYPPDPPPTASRTDWWTVALMGVLPPLLALGALIACR